MAVGVLLITHEGIGDALLATARSVFGGEPIPSSALSVARDRDPDDCVRDALALGTSLEAPGGLLVLTDLFGSTPANVAARVVAELPAGGVDARLVAGVNLPMLLRVFNYAKLPLDDLVDKALEGGRAGVVS